MERGASSSDKPCKRKNGRLRYAPVNLKTINLIRPLIFKKPVALISNRLFTLLLIKSKLTFKIANYYYGKIYFPATILVS